MQLFYIVQLISQSPHAHGGYASATYELTDNSTVFGILRMICWTHYKSATSACVGWSLALGDLNFPEKRLNEWKDARDMHKFPIKACCTTSRKYKV